MSESAPIEGACLIGLYRLSCRGCPRSQSHFLPFLFEPLPWQLHLLQESSTVPRSRFGHDNLDMSANSYKDHTTPWKTYSTRCKRVDLSNK